MPCPPFPIPALTELVPDDLQISSLGPCTFPSPLQRFASLPTDPYPFVEDEGRALFNTRLQLVQEQQNSAARPHTPIRRPRRQSARRTLADEGSGMAGAGSFSGSADGA